MGIFAAQAAPDAVRGGGDSTPPNIVFILVDDLGHSGIESNNPYVKGPRVGELQAEGLQVLFTYPRLYSQRQNLEPQVPVAPAVHEIELYPLVQVLEHLSTVLDIDWVAARPPALAQDLDKNKQAPVVAVTARPIPSTITYREYARLAIGAIDDPACCRTMPFVGPDYSTPQSFLVTVQGLFFLFAGLVTLFFMLWVGYTLLRITFFGSRLTHDQLTED
eukprot:gene2457-3223_t